MILKKILETKRQEINKLKQITSETLTLSTNNFLEAIQNRDISIISELKSKSPSEGILDEDYNPINNILNS